MRVGVGGSRGKEGPCLFSLTQHALELHFSHMLSVTYPASPYVGVVRPQAPSCCELSSGSRRVAGHAEDGMRWLPLLWGGLRLEEGAGGLLS